MAAGLAAGDEDEHKIRQELSDIPLGELQNLRRQMGTKKFDSTFQKQLQQQRLASSESERDFKRANKHRPRELSSKKPVSRYKQVVIVPKKEKGRDPRFDDRCGHLNMDLFSKSFPFLEDVKKQEKVQLENEIKKTREPRMKKRLEDLLKKMESRESNKQREKEKRQLEKEHKKCERELTKEGKNPFYFSKALQRKALLVKRYKELKESGQLQRVLCKRRKRNAAKDRKRIPMRTKY